ncbi:CD276 antigen-like isoform X2 [Anguilla rostrata]|uniref:CD276 antigen-like isoform X2 n=1 Tax=Anguilla rostrata TaxID=7938 RepID=UPI0030CB8C74
MKRPTAVGEDNAQGTFVWRKMASVIWILSVVLYAEFMCAVSVYEFLSLDCQDENHGVLGKDSLLKCFLNTRGDSVMLISASWWRPGGKPPLIIFRNNEVLEPEDPRFSFKQLPMSDSNIDVSFLVRNTVRTDEGEYECVVETDSGYIVVYTKAVSLSVTATYSKPDMSSVPEKDLQEGMEVTLFCNASGGYPVGMIHWYDQHGTNWTRSAEMMVVETTDKRTNLSSKVTLKASSITPQYRCLVLNNNGVEEGEAEFDLKFRKKEFVSLYCQDENHGVHGKDSLLKCFLNSGGKNVTVTAASWWRPGEKRPLIKFRYNKVSVREDPRFSFKQLQMSGSNIDVSFLVRNTLWKDEGKYECKVLTDSGYAKAVVSLSVTATYSKPDMSSVPEKDLQEGMEVTLFCNASGGYPVGMIRWYDQYGTDWTPSAEMTVVETTDKRTNLSSKVTLRASSITPQYRCLVLNNNGVEEGKAEFALKFREKEGDQGSMGSMSSTASTASTAVLIIVIPLLCGLLILALLRRRRIQPARRLSTHPILGAMYPEGSDMMEEGFLRKGVQAMQWITISSCSTSSAGLNKSRSMDTTLNF